jgi:DNA mismatch repair protein MSH2
MLISKLDVLAAFALVSSNQ